MKGQEWILGPDWPCVIMNSPLIRRSLLSSTLIYMYVQRELFTLHTKCGLLDLIECLLINTWWGEMCGILSLGLRGGAPSSLWIGRMLAFVLFLPCCPAFWMFHCLLASLLEEETNERS